MAQRCWQRRSQVQRERRPSSRIPGTARNFIRPRTARTTDPATRSIPTVSPEMIGRAVMPGCIIATTAISITVTTGKRGGIDPELGPNWLIPCDLTSLTANKRCPFEAGRDRDCHFQHRSARLHPVFRLVNAAAGRARSLALAPLLLALAAHRRARSPACHLAHRSLRKSGSDNLP